MKCGKLSRDEIAQETFAVAERYSAACNALHRADVTSAAIMPGYDAQQLLALPAIVIEAFSVELYLKALHAVCGNVPPPRGHDLWKLFSGLPTSVRMEVEKRFNAMNSADRLASRKAKLRGHKRVPTLEESLKSAADVFIEVRYPWEEDFRVHDFDLGCLRGILRTIILQKSPDFRSFLKTMTISGYIFTPCGSNCRGLLGTCRITK